ncbi:MAG: DUF2971 domain-containing protein [Saprospiraceae bacterium]
MMETNWRGVSYDDIEVPEPLYKFREWDNPLHRTILTDQIVYLSPPSGFEDPLDCKNPVRFDLWTHRELNKRFFDESLRRHPHWSKKRHKKFAKHWMKRTPIRNPRRYREIGRIIDKMFDDRFGVLCLTAVLENFEVWEKYADKHKGFCVGFSGKALLGDFSKFGMTGHVEYYPKLPIIHPNDDFKDRGWKRAFSKIEKWSFEREYRTTKIKPDEAVGNEWRKVKVPLAQFVEIVFGALMPVDQVEEITRLATDIFPNIKFRQAEVNQENKSVTVIDLTR